MFEWDEEGRRWSAMHHPFTSPQDDDAAALRAFPAGALARAYDMVLNGSEIGGGSVRIHREEMQSAVFELLGIEAAEAHAKFGFLLEALKLGAPPHGGIAFGLDRLAMLMAGADSIREVIAFPKTQTAADPLTDAPTRTTAPVVRVGASQTRSPNIRGRRRVEAVLWVARTACSWRHLPEHFGPWETIVYHYRRWCKEGIWERVLQILLSQDASPAACLFPPVP